MLHYDIFGEGQPLILVHGFGEDHRIWQKTIPALQKQARIIVPHLPGTGKSKPEPTVSMDSMADELLAIADQEKFSHFVLIGHSMGGYISLALAKKAPQRIKALGLFHSTAFPDSEEKMQARLKSIAFIETHGTAAYLATSTENLFAPQNRQRMAAVINELATSNSYISKQTMVAFLRAMMGRPDRQDALKTSAYPVLFLFGEFDQAVPYEQSLKLAHLPNISYIHVLHQTGHMGMLEEPATANQYLKDFLDQV